ncbi:MAG: hypothetical protein QM811_26905 [Pirellulales bacterium]
MRSQPNSAEVVTKFNTAYRSPMSTARPTSGGVNRACIFARMAFNRAASMRESSAIRFAKSQAPAS